MPYLISARCTGCGACLPECPTGSILEGFAQYRIDPDSCCDHASCVAVCPEDAIVPMPAEMRAPLLESLRRGAHKVLR